MEDLMMGRGVVRAVFLQLQALPSGMEVHRWDLTVPRPNLCPSCLLQLNLSFLVLLPL